MAEFQKFCKQCGHEVSWPLVCEEFEDLMWQADSYGVESCTENEQVVLEGYICTGECFELFDAEV